MQIPQINRDKMLMQTIHPIDELVPSKSKKIQCDRWGPTSKLLNINIPQAVTTPLIKKKFKITIRYQINPTAKPQNKTIYFGDDQDYVFTKDKEKRFRRLMYMKHTDNPLHPNYWKAVLLNKYQTIDQGLTEFNKYFIKQAYEALATMPKKKEFIKPPYLQPRRVYVIPPQTLE